MEKVGGSSPGADLDGFRDDSAVSLPESISPRLLGAGQKTGYLGLPTGSGDSVRDTFRHIGTGLGSQICRTAAGQLQDMLFREIYVTVKTIVFSRISNQESFFKHEKSTQGIKWENFVEPLFGEKIWFSRCRTKPKSVLQNHDLSCSRPLVSCRRYKPSQEPALVLRFGPGHPGTSVFF